MKKSLFFVVTVGVVTAFVPFGAHADILGSIAGTLFGFVMNALGFTEELSGYCWFCPIITTLLGAAGSIAAAVYNSTATFLSVLLGLGTLFFLLFKVAAMVVKLQEVDVFQFLGEIAKVLGRVIIAAAIIRSSTFITQEIITPFIGFSTEFSLKLIEGEGDVENKVWKSLDKHLDYNDNAKTQIEAARTQINTELRASGSAGDVISPAMTQSLIAITAKISANLVVGMGVGAALILLSMFSSLVFVDFQNFISGGAIFMAFAVLYMVVPFQIIGIIIELTFVLALLPFWAVLWVFPITAQYTKKAFDMFLHACLTIMIFGVLTVIVLKLVGYMLPNSDDILGELIPGYDLLAGKKSNGFSNSVLLTLALGFLCKELLKSAPELATRITNVYGLQAADSAAVATTAVVAAAGGGTLMQALKLGKAFNGGGYGEAKELSESGATFGRNMFGLKEGESVLTNWVLGDNKKDSQTPAAPQNKYQAPAAPAATPSATPSQPADNQPKG